MVGVCSYLLVSFWFTRIYANQSSLSAFLTNRVGDCFLTIGMFAILWCLGNKKKNNVFKCEYSSASYTYVAALRISKAAKNNRYISSRSYEAGYPLEVLGERQIRRYSTSSSNLEGRSQFQSSQVKINCNLGSYLAGLIEGDGYIGVQDPNTDAKVIHRPKIIIAFNINDKPLAKKLSAELNVGKVLDREKSGIVILQILAKEDVLKIINLINGVFRTGKIFELHRCINWFNKNINTNIEILPIDSSSIDSNAWLAGFSQKKASFSISSVNKLRVILNYKLKINIDLANSNRSSLLHWFSLFCVISKYFSTSFITKVESDQKCTIIMYAYPLRSKNKVLEYYSKYPLSCKVYLDYLLWSETFKITGGNSLVNIKTKDKLTNLKSRIFNNISDRTINSDNLNYYLPGINQSNFIALRPSEARELGKKRYSTQIDNKNSSLYMNKAWFFAF